MKRNAESLPLGVIVEKRVVDNPWIDHVWKPVAVVAGVPELDPQGPWRDIEQGDGWVRYLAGTLQMQLFRKETEAYKVNLTQNPPRIFVVLRPNEEADGQNEIYPLLVTASPYEAQDYLDSGEDIVEGVPMPDAVIAFVETFVSEFHVDEPFYKRKRKRYNPDDAGFGKKPPDRLN